MARENDVRLFGEIVRINKEGGLGNETVTLRVIRRNMDREDFVDVVVSPEHTGGLEAFQIGDFVDIQGFFSTWESEEAIPCVHCGESLKDVTFHSSVVAMYARKYPHPIHLPDHKEVSNRIYLLGHVMGKINAITVQTIDSEFDTTRYRMLVKRRIRMADTEQDADRPFVSSFGNQAVNDSLRLQDGCMIFINGSIQSRTIHVKHSCPYCGEISRAEKSIMEVVPLGVEYLKGCRSWSHGAKATVAVED